MNFKTLETKTIEFNDVQRQYRVVDRNVPGAPKYFVGYGEGLPFISDEVPEEYQEKIVRHELTEFEVLKDEEDKCLKSLKAELSRVPAGDLDDYIPFRIETFQHLMNYLEKDEPDSQLISEVRKSLAHLESL